MDTADKGLSVDFCQKAYEIAKAKLITLPVRNLWSQLITSTLALMITTKK